MAKTKLEELVVQLTVENKSLVSQLKSSQAETSKAMQTMSKSIEGFAKDSNANVSSFQRIFETAMGFVGGQVVMAAFSRAKDAAAALFKTLVNDGVAAAQVQEDAINDLNSALARTGQYTRETSQELQAYASSLQESSKYGDEAILTTMSLIQSLGGLEKEGLKGATQATLDMAAALNIDLKAAATLVGKAAAGEVSSFTRYGVAITKGKDAAETFANTLEALKTKFGGAAAAQVKTYSGAVQQLKNTFGDTTEEIGFVFTQNAALLGSIDVLNRAFKEGGEEVKANREALQKLVSDGIILVAESLPTMVMALGVTTDMFIETIKWTHALTGGLADLVGANEQAEEAAESFAAAVETQDKAAATFEKIAMAADRMKNRIIEAAEQGSAAQAEMNAMYEAQAEAARKAKEEEILLSEEQKKNAEAGRELALNAILAIEEDNAIKNELQAEQYALEQQQLQAALDQKLISQQQYLTAAKALEDKAAAEHQKREQAKHMFDLKMQTSRVDLLSSTANLMSAVAGRESKAAFFMSRAAAIAQSIVATRVASAMALATPPGPPYTIPLAANVELAGNINTAAIAATAIQGFNKGGTVPGVGFHDSVPAMLTPQEEVVDRSTSKLLRQYLNSAMASGPGGHMTFKHFFDFGSMGGFIEFVETEILERQAMGTSKLPRFA